MKNNKTLSGCFGSQIRIERMSAKIPGQLLCARAGISRSKLSEIESGHIAASQSEERRLHMALQELINARKEVEVVAKRVGWPL